MQHHGASLRKLTHDDALVDALAADPETAPLSVRSRAFVDFAIELTRTPAAVNQDHLAPLRAQGLTDRGVHDLVCVVAYFNYVNRLTLGLGVELEK